jgi:cation diffusion facilitator family transporter
MHEAPSESWHRDHSFGQDQKRPGEVRMLIVIAITVVMMVVEIAAGIAFHSIALLADGLHMASHAAALSISAFAYIYARRHAHDERFSFGTGKVNALGGFCGAILLGVFALMMAWESVWRLIRPEEIAFNLALLVAVSGLIVNGICVLVLGHTHGHEREHECDAHDHPHHSDHNLLAAYFHVLADALTSVLAIAALLAGKYFGWIWMDPAMGLIGTILVARWSLGLVRMTSRVLLDRQAPQHIMDAIREEIEKHDDNRVVDLHVWSIGPQIFAAEVVILTKDPQLPRHYKRMLPRNLGLAHLIVEVHTDSEAVADVPLSEPFQ